MIHEKKEQEQQTSQSLELVITITFPNLFFKVVVFIIFTLKIVNTCIKNSFQFSDRCVMPLGLEDKRVPNGHLTASSYYNYHLSPWYGRLNSIYSWSVRRNRVGQWFQVNFVELMRIKGVATQGRQNANQWVRSYTVRYSVDGMSFRPYIENRRFKVMYCSGHICLKSQVYKVLSRVKNYIVIRPQSRCLYGENLFRVEGSLAYSSSVPWASHLFLHFLTKLGKPFT